MCVARNRVAAPRQRGRRVRWCRIELVAIHADVRQIRRRAIRSRGVDRFTHTNGPASIPRGSRAIDRVDDRVDARLRRSRTGFLPSWYCADAEPAIASAATASACVVRASGFIALSSGAAAPRIQVGASQIVLNPAGQAISPRTTLGPRPVPRGRRGCRDRSATRQRPRARCEAGARPSRRGRKHQDRTRGRSA